MRLRANLLTIAQDLIDVALSGAFKIKVNQTYPLRDAIKAHQNLQARKTTGSIV
jgi:NADPH2:quinone reductase